MKKSNVFLLVLFIMLAVYLNFMPHLNYKFPLHVDEWVHFQYANHLSSSAPLYFRGEYKSLEAGFHYLLASLNSVGISYLFMFNYFASLVTILICLGVFILTRAFFSETAGVFSVLFIGLLKSSVLILGPVLFVPMAIGMFFIAIMLYLIKINSKAWVLILASILIIHPPTAMAILLLINIEFLLIRKNYIKNLGLQALAFVIAFPLYYSTIMNKGVETIDYLAFNPMPGLVFVPYFLGWAITLICLAGIFFSLEKKNFSLLLYVLSLLFFIFIFYHYKIEIFIPYRRALMYLFLIFSMAFGIGFSGIIDIFSNKKLKILIGIILVILVVGFSLSSKIKSNGYFYQIIDNNDYEDFIWIKENTNKDSLAVSDPWKANALSPIAEREVFSRIVQGPNLEIEAKNNKIYDFFQEKCKNIDFLKENNISIIYGNCENPNLRKVHDRVYSLEG